MGSPADEIESFDDEGPLHRVRLGGFLLGQTPVTQAQWAVVSRWPKMELDLQPDPSSFEGALRIRRRWWRWSCAEAFRKTGQALLIQRLLQPLPCLYWVGHGPGVAGGIRAGSQQSGGQWQDDFMVIFSLAPQ